MKINHLIQGLGLRCVCGDASVEVSDLYDDSRQVRPGSLFVARMGTQASGKSYIREAIDRGAVAVLCQTMPPETDERVTWIVGSEINHALTGTLAERFFDHPSRQLRLLGITGTNGKTTISFFIRHLLCELGIKCGLVGTIELDDGQQKHPAKLTTPGAIDLSRLLRKMVDHGCLAAVLEVSSHALDQGRTDALDFCVGVFTNLTGDHLDYHGHMDAYAQAKAKLFTNLRPTALAVLNAEDPYSATMMKHCDARALWCEVTDEPRTLTDRESVCVAGVLKLFKTHSLAQFEGPWGCYDLTIPMPGKHNVSNALLAMAAANAVAPVSQSLCHAMETMRGVPGRLEQVQIESDSPLPCVMVDYAHTHDALEHVLQTLRPLCDKDNGVCGGTEEPGGTGGLGHAQGNVSGGEFSGKLPGGLPGERLLLVFGCGGDRDTAKRAKMAAVACEYADLIYVTTDNPRTEDPQAILDQIYTGVTAQALSRVFRVADRREAIMMAIAEARVSDTVLVAGKGHEDYQILGDHRYHFDDREVAAEALRMKAGQT